MPDPAQKDGEMKDGLVMKYFVLKPRGTDAYAKASRAAMFRYVQFIKDENPELAEQMKAWAERESIDANFEKSP